jgi:hypothetical protein
VIRHVNSASLVVRSEAMRGLQPGHLRHDAAPDWIENIQRGSTRVREQQHAIGENRIAESGCAWEIDHADLAQVGGARAVSNAEEDGRKQESGNAHEDFRWWDAQQS